MEEVTCKVCSTKFDLSKSYYCPECGFEVHIYPAPISPELKNYEEERVKKYKKMWKQGQDSKKENEKLVASKKQQEEKLSEIMRQLEIAESTPKEDPILGFLVLGQNSETFNGNVQYEILDVFRIYDGENLFGRIPQERDNVHSNSILFKCPEMKKEHFSINASNEGGAIANLRDGRWGVRNKDNNVKKEFLIDRDEIFIGNLIFTYIKL